MQGKAGEVRCCIQGSADSRVTLGGPLTVSKHLSECLRLMAAMFRCRLFHSSLCAAGISAGLPATEYHLVRLAKAVSNNTDLNFLVYMQKLPMHSGRGDITLPSVLATLLT